jgi:hypothetical protein
MLIHGDTGQRVIFLHHDVISNINNSDTGKIHTNRGAPGTIRFYLPEDAPSGIEFTFAIVESFQLNLDPQSKTLFCGDDVIPAKYYGASVIGSVLRVCADENGDW